MSEHRVRVDWSRDDQPFGPDYRRDHTWVFEGGATVAASSTPELFGNPDLVDPEQAFVASISSCHMLWFLFLAAKRGHVVDGYVDAAVGHMARDADGVTWIQRVELRPEIRFGDGGSPPPDAIRALHDEAHERCFIASSVRTEIEVHA